MNDIDRYRKLIMESVPRHAGDSTTKSVLRLQVRQYCYDFGTTLDVATFEQALRELHDKQCLVLFSENDVRPTQFGLNSYKLFY